MGEEIVQTTIVEARTADGSVQHHRYDIVRINGGLAMRFTIAETGETQLSTISYST